MKPKKKNRFNAKFVFITLLIICLAGIILGLFRGFSAKTGRSFVSTLLAPMQEGVNSIGNMASDISGHRKSMDELKEENEALNQEINILKSQITSMENNLSEYEDLLSLLELSKKYPSYDMTGARIISKNSNNWYNSFTINKGSLHGLKRDMNVIAGNGLVGIITEVTPNTAQVRSIIDDTSNVSGMISKNLDICIVNGDMKLIDSGLLNIELISKEANILDGDEVVTSYISDKYLPGILIGYISDATSDETELTYNAKLTPAVDFQHLSDVLVIKQLKEDLTNQVSEKKDTSPKESESESETEKKE